MNFGDPHQHRAAGRRAERPWVHSWAVTGVPRRGSSRRGPPRRLSSPAAVTTLTACRSSRARVKQPCGYAEAAALSVAGASATGRQEPARTTNAANRTRPRAAARSGWKVPTGQSAGPARNGDQLCGLRGTQEATATWRIPPYRPGTSPSPLRVAPPTAGAGRQSAAAGGTSSRTIDEVNQSAPALPADRRKTSPRCYQDSFAVLRPSGRG